ncbi:heme utilization cystosolic carrier protein HutX [Simiduia agarivorans]|uniref:Heme iron utilization protein n=1 Tax=Simiduia agarivorans (strain DSM 21679 / JCM 13881 / BCRC 17597 / SA1) TaxID=1117647 RepID=K4KQH4_SIMAS|nr:heme utilization cystosolic carrier protein HutX [Simiduia agarivorans]AFV00369.1 Putative heme iron utilization protein [Simiduia agarivorans SA1 = DSM 21679]
MQTIHTLNALPGVQAETVLRALPSWGPVTTIVLHGGSVFEFKGPFPDGFVAEGFYNLKGETGFEGHLNLSKIDHIAFQDKLHRGRQSLALVFNDASGAPVFKVFVGRDSEGELIGSQVNEFRQLQEGVL